MKNAEWEAQMERGTEGAQVHVMFEDWQREVKELQRALVIAFVQGVNWYANEKDGPSTAGAEAEARRRQKDGTLGQVLVSEEDNMGGEPLRILTQTYLTKLKVSMKVVAEAVVALEKPLGELSPSSSLQSAVFEHGKDCRKSKHDPRAKGYMHGAKEDTPYDVGGLLKCGRCYTWMDSQEST